jgi:hypothetical protein
MLQTVFSTAGSLRDLVVSGMTDLQIIEEALRGEGITREHISSRKSQLKECYIREMKRAVGDGVHVIVAIPGAHEALKAVDEHPRYRSALLTGNIEPAAHLKVEVAGLAKFFTLPGAFGDESLIDEIFREAVERSSTSRPRFIRGAVHRDWRYPNDVACATLRRGCGVTTGRILRRGACLPAAPICRTCSMSDLFMNTLAEL